VAANAADSIIGQIIPFPCWKVAIARSFSGLHFVLMHRRDHAAFFGDRNASKVRPSSADKAENRFS
jgi:hypothetical protein